jgi:predicted Zn-dependent peptidase
MTMRMSTVLVCIFFGGACLTAQETKKEAPPAPAAPKDFKIPRPTTVSLPNGIALTMVPYGTIPKVAIELVVRTGVIDEGPNDVSLSSVMADMLLEGTTTRSAPQISQQAAGMGGSVSANAGGEATTIGGEVLSEFAAPFLSLIGDIGRNPRFDSTDLSRIIGNHARDNAIALSTPGALAQKKFREMIYGSHPFGRTIPPEAMLRAFTTARVRDFHSKNFGAKRAHVYVSGVFDRAKVEQAFRDAFANWTAGEPPTVKPVTPAAKRQVALVDRPKSVQSAIWMGVPAAAPSDSDWIRMNVTDGLLGGTFGSRITTNIREDKGYTYSPGSFLWSRKGSATWVEVADVTTNVTGPALTEIFKEIDRLRTEPPPAAELKGVANNLAGIFTVQNSSRGGVVNQLEFADLHGLGDDYLSTYVKRLMAVTPEEVRNTAIKYIDPAKISIAIVGDKKVVEPQLGAFKPIVP